MPGQHTRVVVNGCPRCGGDLFLDRYEEEFFCLQCGRRTAIARALKGRTHTEGGGEDVLGQILQDAELVAAGR